MGFSFEIMGLKVLQDPLHRIKKIRRHIIRLDNLVRPYICQISTPVSGQHEYSFCSTVGCRHQV